MRTLSIEKFLVIVRPPDELRLEIVSALQVHCGLSPIETGWAAANLHMSLSDRHYRSDPAPMLRACERVRVPAFDLTLNRITYEGHLTLRALGDKPRAFVELIESIRQELAKEGIDDVTGHTAHITLSYDSPIRLDRSIHLKPMALPVDEFELVVGGGDPYAYTTIGKWPLGPRVQADLFT